MNMEESVKPEGSFELLKTPEIVIQNEEGAQLLSLILKAKNPEWGSTESQLAKETTTYFEANPLNKETSEFLDEIRALEKDGIDEEALYILALTYEHPEREEGAFEVIRKHKEYIKDPQELQQKVFRAIVDMKRVFDSSPLAEKFNSEAEQDKKARLENMEETKERIEKIIGFFKPDSKTTSVRKISLMPTDPLYKVNSGNGPRFGEEAVLRTHIKNPDNLDHEFSHSIINPIVEKLSQQLTEEQKRKISQMASEKLKTDYGEEYFSLLCEEFIRTYNDIFKRGEEPQTYETFQRKLNRKNDEQFDESFKKEEKFREACLELEIKTLSDLKEKSQEFFERFLKDSSQEKNELRDLIFKFYKEYGNRPDESVNFEKFVLDNFANKI